MTAKVTNNSNNNNNNKGAQQKAGVKGEIINNKQQQLGGSVDGCCGGNNKTSEVRRANKPLMEKRRRARINQSLAMLKTLILDSAKMDNTKHSKLEKADILELTVRHFQRHRNLDTPGINKYKAGYTDCVREIQRYLDTPDAQTMSVIDQSIRQRLMRHLEACIGEIDTDISPITSKPADASSPVATPANEYRSPHIAYNGGKTTPAAFNSTDGNSFKPAEINLAYSIKKEPEVVVVEQKISLEADSSTQHPEEINNNTEDVAVATEQPRVPDMSAAALQAGAMPNTLFQTPDGNFVFVLPSHYVQLAAALGLNLNQTLVTTNMQGGVETSPVGNKKIVQYGGGDASSSSSSEYNSGASTTSMEVDNVQTKNGCNEAPEKPLDFSKNNDINGDMWRPW